MRTKQSIGRRKDDPCPQHIVVDLSFDQQQAAKEEARRWGLDINEMIQFILRWGWLEYFKR